MSISILILDDSKVARIGGKRAILQVVPDAQISETDQPLTITDLTDHNVYDLILLDFNMPDEDGLSVATRLLQSKPDLKIALLTANIQDSIMQRAAALGIPFLKKPLQPDVIKSLLIERGLMTS